MSLMPMGSHVIAVEGFNSSANSVQAGNLAVVNSKKCFSRILLQKLEDSSIEHPTSIA
jgi:hypothetical protein